MESLLGTIAKHLIEKGFKTEADGYEVNLVGRNPWGHPSIFNWNSTYSNPLIKHHIKGEGLNLTNKERLTHVLLRPPISPFYTLNASQMQAENVDIGRSNQ